MDDGCGPRRVLKKITDTSVVSKEFMQRLSSFERIIIDNEQKKNTDTRGRSRENKDIQS